MLKNQLRISSLLRGPLYGIFVLWVLFFVAFIVSPSLFHANVQSFVLLGFLIFATLLLLKAPNRSAFENGIRLAIGYVVTITFVQRYLFLTIFPFSFGRDDGQGGALRLYTVEEFNLALGATVVFLAAIIAALYMTAKHLSSAAFSQEHTRTQGYTQFLHKKYLLLYRWRFPAVTLFLLSSAMFSGFRSRYTMQCRCKCSSATTAAAV